MTRAEADARKYHDNVVIQLKSELASATRHPDPSADPSPRLCPECPVKQARIDSLVDQLAAARKGKGDAERQCQQLHDDMAAASAEYKADREKFFGELNQANFAASAAKANQELAEKQVQEAKAAASALESKLLAQLETPNQHCASAGKAQRVQDFNRRRIGGT